MENNHLSGQETVLGGQCGSSLQVFGDFSLKSQKSVELFAEEDDASLSEDDVSLSEFGEEYELGNKEDLLEIEDIDALEANNENEKKDELCIGMEFSSEDTAHMVYKGVRKEPKVNRSYTRPITRCGCKAHMACYLQSSARYKIVSFDQNHNHELVRTPMKHLLKGNRAAIVSQK
ncbi:hypothetical protein F2Q69_00014578 [Brassica cretica]|uniref:FAR1 domain-containing protein n=1 Tax=Brassica cretica TaxID=69181 RepID=A0A8S9QYU7_BRACR|nr:hypothetical protein F2Q69_00014578 [Brassica cretica]